MKSIVSFLSLIILVIFSCCTTKKIVTSNKSAKHQKLKEHRVTYRDTLLYTPISSTSLNIPLKDFNFINKSIRNDSSITKKVYKNKNGNAIVKVVVKKDTVHITSVCDSILLVAKIRKELLKEFVTSSNTTSKTEQKERLPLWFILSISVLAIASAIRILKPFQPFKF